MVMTDSEGMSQGEVDSPLLKSDQLLQPRNNNNSNNQHPMFSSLGRQSSIYSLTLDEFQHTLCESGKNFGSMNMDEFLTSIWNAEENQATTNSNATDQDHVNANGVHSNHSFNDGERGISRQPSLHRQGSLTLPPPLCRKTVDEVWSEIHLAQQSKVQNDNGGGGGGNVGNMLNSESAPRQPTFGEMTLEDFLVKAGVVREQVGSSTRPLPHQQQQYGLYQGGNNNNDNNVGTGFVSRPILGMGGGGDAGGVPYQAMPLQSSAPIGQSSGRNSGYSPPTAAATGGVYGGIMGNGGGGGGGGYGAGQGMGVGPVSPVSSEGIVGGVDTVGNQFGMDMGSRGRKRIIDGPVEKVVERRQRRMIKNRESAARSRARKQAYTVELEAELNQLKEENRQIKHALAELERKRKQQYFEDLKTRVQTKAQKSKEKLRVLRRNMSCPL